MSEAHGKAFACREFDALLAFTRKGKVFRMQASESVRHWEAGPRNALHKLHSVPKRCGTLHSITCLFVLSYYAQ